MPTYPTSHPIDLAVDIQVGSVEIVATDRADAVVAVSPSSPSKAGDRRAAEDTEVAFDGGRLSVIGPRPRMSWVGPSESVDLRIEVPSGSRLTASVAWGDVRSSGRLAATRVKSSSAHLDVTGDLWVRASHGDVHAAAVEGGADVDAAHGRIRIESVHGDARLSASHGGVRLGRADGDVEAKLSYGDFDVDRALGSVTAKTAYGSIRLGEVSGGSAQVESGFGGIELGVRRGVPAWLDLASKNGRVRNELDADVAPAPDERSVAVRARTAFGDITVSRAR